MSTSLVFLYSINLTVCVMNKMAMRNMAKRDTKEVLRGFARYLRLPKLRAPKGLSGGPCRSQSS